MLKVKNGGQRLFLGVQSVHPRLTTARIKGKPLLEKNVSTKAKTKTKTSKNTKTKTWTQTKTKTDKKSTRQHHPDLREAPILKNTLQDLIYTERQFCQMETCLKGCSTATTSLDESLSVRPGNSMLFFSLPQPPGNPMAFLPNKSLLNLRHPDWI